MYVKIFTALSHCRLRKTFCLNYKSDKDFDRMLQINFEIVETINPIIMFQCERNVSIVTANLTDLVIFKGIVFFRGTFKIKIENNKLN